MPTRDDLPDDESIEHVVLQVLQENWGPPLLDWARAKLLGETVPLPSRSDKLVGDVWGDGDDASAFALEVVKRLRLDVPVCEWRNVETVQQAIDLLKRQRDRLRQGERP